jgi:hypothetical protein
LGEVEFTVEQTLKAGAAVAEMYTDDAVVDLATTTQPLPSGTDRMPAAFDRSRFVKATDGLPMSVFAGNYLLALVPHFRLLPLDRFHETL